jgi:hypothetical protein
MWDAASPPDLKLKNLAAPLMRTSRSQRVAIFMILSGFGFEVAWELPATMVHALENKLPPAC